jgi:hypothetical protein
VRILSIKRLDINHHILYCIALCRNDRYWSMKRMHAAT